MKQICDKTILTYYSFCMDCNLCKFCIHIHKQHSLITIAIKHFFHYLQQRIVSVETRKNMSKQIRPSSRGSAEAAASLTSVTTAVLPANQSSPFADTCEPNSYSEVSVRSDCDRSNFRNTSLASADTSKNYTTYRNPELEKKRTEGPLFDTSHPDFVHFHEERIAAFPNASGSTLLWHKNADVCDIIVHGRQPPCEKHTERVVPNPWRRFGTLTKLTSVGGWSNKRKKSVCFEVKPGSAPPNAPNAPQMMLHRDAKRPIHFAYPGKNVSSEICAQKLALQIALRVENSWMNMPWYNPKRLHFMESGNPYRSSQQKKSGTAAAAPSTTSKQQTTQVSTAPEYSRSSSMSISDDDDDCATALTGRFSNTSISTSSSVSTATPNVRKSKNKK